jgi:hypothetical protein
VAYFGDMVMFKSYNGCVVITLSILISSIHDLLINLCIVGPRKYISRERHDHFLASS